MSPEFVASIIAVIGLVVLNIFLHQMSKNDWDKAPYFFFGNLIGLILWLIPVVLFFFFFTETVDRYSEIVSVAGCDRYANCTVKLKDGTVKQTQNAFIGDLLLSERQIVWKK